MSGPHRLEAVDVDHGHVVQAHDERDVFQVSPDEPVDDATNAFGRLSDSAAAADVISTWLFHRIGDYFATRVSPGPTS